MSRGKAFVSLCLALVSGVTLAAMTPPPPRLAGQKEQQAFRNAMLRGNANAALRIVDQSGEGSFATAIYRDQLEYRLPQMMAASRECRDRAFQAGVGKAALYCNELVFSIAGVLGDARAAFHALAWRRKHGAAIWAKEHPGEKFPLKFPVVDVAKLARSIPTYSTGLDSAAPVRLPYVAGAASAAGFRDHEMSGSEAANSRRPARPVVRVVINGHHVEALIDTGEPSALVVSASQAKDLALRPLVAGLPRIVHRMGQSPVPAGTEGWSLVSTLALGPLRVRNLLAIVVPDRYNADNPSVIIGLPLLAKFDRVAFQRSSMVVNAPALPCDHSLPITYASYPNLYGTLDFTAEADGEPIRAMIDTGSVNWLIVGPRLIPKADTEAAAANDRAQNWQSRPIRLAIGKSLTTGGAALMYVGLPKTQDVNFGFPQPWLQSVRFDFSAMSICLAPRRLGGPAREVRSPPTTLITSLPVAGLPHPATRLHRRAFQIPMLSGMDLYPGYAVVDRYTPPPPPWLHVRIHCAIANGNVYIDGTVTGNYGRPIPGAVFYQGFGDVVTGKVTSSRSGQLHGIEPLTGGHVGLPPGLRRFPMRCVAPNVNVGTPSGVMQNGQGAKAVH